jgi:hypothetical protein
MIDLYNASTNELIGNIIDADLQVLVDGRATDHLVGLLRRALGSTDGVDIRWQRR